MIWFTGTSGANEDMLAYCRKWWPSTGNVVKTNTRETLTFYSAGNAVAYESTRDVFLCVEATPAPSPAPTNAPTNSPTKAALANAVTQAPTDAPTMMPTLAPTSTPTFASTTKRISYWYGKVNQHNDQGVWKTDSDGTSGADIDMLQYCKKFWATTTSIRKLPDKEAITFKTQGNLKSYVSTREVYECVEAAYFSTDKRISYWSGKVNQHNDNGVWMTDPDGE